MSITTLAKDAAKYDRAEALADYRRLLRTPRPSVKDARRLNEVQQTLQLTDAQIEADQRAILQVATITSRTPTDERIAAAEDARGHAAPGIVGELADVVRDALAACRMVENAREAAMKIVHLSQWLDDDTRSNLLGRVRAAAGRFAQLSDPDRLRNHVADNLAEVRQVKANHPLAFEDALRAPQQETAPIEQYEKPTVYVRHSRPDEPEPSSVDPMMNPNG